MSKISRHEVRECLLQALYSISMQGTSFDLKEFLITYYDESFLPIMEDTYFQTVFSGVPSREAELVAIVKKYAPKFDVAIMPVVNILPIFIASYEMMFMEEGSVPEKVSIDEAIELAKKFSDEPTRMLVNGVLNSLRVDKEAIRAEFPQRITGYQKNIFSI